MDQGIGSTAVAILLFIAFVVPFVVIVMDDRTAHQK